MKRNSILSNTRFSFFVFALILCGRLSSQVTLTYNYTGSLQNLTIPPCVSVVTIEVRGGQGGTATGWGYPGGLGAIMKGTFNVTGGTVLNIMVGAKGNDESVTSGGGGGSGVAIGVTPLIVAGGGAGVDGSDPGYAGRHAVITTSGVDGSGNGGSAGVSGSDGVGNTWVGNGNNIAYGGRGWNAGITGSTGQNGSTVNTGFTNGTWGLGGGGGSVGAGFCNCGGGGGGYSGGGSGNINASGGGGGSYNSGFNQVNTPAANSGNGVVIISYNNIVPLNTASASSSVICSGASAVLTAPVATSYTWSTGANTQTISVSPTSSTIYTVTSTASITCVLSSTIGVVVMPTPTVALSSSAPSVCSGVSVNLNGTASTSSVINYYTVATGGSSIGNTTSGVNFPVTPAVTTTYYAQGTSMSASGSQTLNYSGSIVNFTVPNGVYYMNMEARGAQGANGGGLGASLKGTFTVTPGQVLKILVGQAGSASSAIQAGGGGGSFITDNLNNPLLIAGGGGGRAQNAVFPTPGINANITQNGNNGYSTLNGLGYPFDQRYGIGGSSGNGGSNGAPAADIPHAGNGGGLLTNGNNGACGTGGSAFINGGGGGTGCSGGNGGFGGGGGGGWNGGGGGGGYSGGGGSYHDPTNGGGGGSYNSGYNQVNTAGVQSGDGLVVLSWNVAGGCLTSPRVPVTITVNPRPTLGVSATNPVICAGGTTALNGSGASTYTWTGTGSPTNGTPFSPASTTSYTLSGTSAAGCTSTLNPVQSITVNPLPTVVANATSTVICIGNTVTLSGSGASTYTWTGGVTNNVAFAPGSTLTYTVTGTDGNGCKNTASKTVTVNPLPVVSGSATNPTICMNSLTTLNGSGANTYTWTGGATNGSPFSPPSTTTYSLTGTSLAGCTSTNLASVTITVLTLPVVSASASNPTICFGGTTTVSGSGANTYTWTGGVTNNVPFSPGATTSYTLTGTDLAGCTSTNTPVQTIVVNPLPNVTANTTSMAICINNSVTLTGGGATTYTWTGGITDGVAFYPTSTSGYTVTGTDGNSCKNSASISIVVNPLPVVSGSATNPTICMNSLTTLNGSGANTYTWTDGAPNGTPFSPTTTTTYTLTGTSLAGCTSTNLATVTITVLALPVVSVSVSNPTICFGGTTSVNGSGANTYTWTGGVTDGVPFSPATTTSYTLTGTDLAGCTSTNAPVQTVVVNPLPNVTANPSSPAICINGSVSLSGGGATTYTWTGGVTDGVAFFPTTTADYTVTGTDGNSCQNSASVTIVVNPLPVVSGSATNPTICMNSLTTLNGSGANTYTWTGGAPNATPFSPTSTTTFSLTGTSLAGCTSTNLATVTITVLALPVVSVSASNPTICFGGTTSVNGSGANTYTWTGGITDGVPFSPASTTSYTLTGTDPAGCTSTNNPVQTIVVNPLPNVTANPSSPAICINGSVSLSGGGATTYTWTGGVTNGVAFFPTTTADYTVTGTDGNTCQNSASVTIVVNALPVVSGSATNPTICMNSLTTLNGSGANTYTWTGGAPNATPFSPASTTTYSLTGTSLAGCTSTNLATVTITVLALPNVSVSASNPVICIGGTTSVHGSGASTYTWTGGVTDGAIFSPTNTASYTLTGTDLAGCTSTNNAVQTITVHPLPVVTAGASTTSICSGGTLTLNGGNAVTYTWTGGVTNGVPFSLTSTTSFTVNGTSAAGCTSTNSPVITITVNPIPSVTASISNPVICFGGTTTLNGSGAATYTWSPTAPDNTPFAPTSSANYSLTGTSAAGCTSTNTAIASLTVNALPTVTSAATSTAICIGGTVTLTGGGANTYTWSGGVSNATPFSPGSTQTYTVVGTNTNNCQGTSTIAVVVNQLPTVTATAINTVVCIGNTVILNGSGASTYTWTGGVTDGVAFVPTITTTYTLTGTSTAGCTNTNSAVQTITVLALPNVSVNVSNPVICFGGTTSLSGSGANTYTWTGGVTDGAPFSPTSTLTYTLTGTDLSGCTSTNTAAQTITVHALPVVTASASSAAICLGQTVSVNGNGANTYTWTGGVVNNVAFSPTSTATYTVDATDLNGCMNSASITVTVNPIPTVTASVTNSVICFGDLTTLSGAGALTYTWTNGAPNAVPFAPTVTSTYTLTGANASGCTNTNVATISVTVNALPVLTITAASPTICMGYSTSLTGSGANTYTWTGGVINGSAFSPTLTNTYTLSGTDANGCVGTASQAIIVNNLPVVKIASSNSISCEAQTVSLTASGASSYTWSSGQNASSLVLTPTVTTQFTVDATDNNGCQNTAYFTQSVIICPEVLSSNSVVTHVTCKGRNNGSIVIEATVPYANKQVSYHWSPATLCPSDSCSSLTGLKAGTYSVMVRVTYTLNNVLVKQDSIAISNMTVLDENPSCELDVYNGITPNGDEINDIWVINNIDLYPKSQVKIFTRWGAEIANISGYDNKTNYWPTPDQASILESATYFYFIDLGDGSAPKKGWIEVMKK